MIFGQNQSKSAPGNFLGLCQHPGSSIEGRAAQMARNLTGPGIELGQQPCWGKLPNEIFLMQRYRVWRVVSITCPGCERSHRRPSFARFTCSNCESGFNQPKKSREAIKCMLTAAAILTNTASNFAIFPHQSEGVRARSSLKEKLFRLSDRSKLKSRVPSRVKTPAVQSPETTHWTSVSES